MGGVSGTAAPHTLSFGCVLTACLSDRKPPGSDPGDGRRRGGSAGDPLLGRPAGKKVQSTTSTTTTSYTNFYYSFHCHKQSATLRRVARQQHELHMCDVITKPWAYNVLIETYPVYIFKR